MFTVGGVGTAIARIATMDLGRCPRVVHAPTIGVSFVPHCERQIASLC